MSFLQGVKELVNVPRYADGRAFPDVGEARLVRIPATEACAGCIKHEDHGEPCRALASRVLFGDQREDLVPNANRIDASFLRSLQSYFWKMGYVVNGVPAGNLLYNLGLGTANNIAQGTNYEVLQIDSTNPRRVQLRGEDPRAVPFGISVENPDFVAPGQGEPRLTTVQARVRMSIGAAVFFRFPSVLVNRLYPWIQEIEPPSGTVGGIKDFWVVLSHSARYAKDPWDAAFPPEDGRYFCEIFSYLVAPEAWDNYQPTTPEGQFALHEREYNAEDIQDQEIELLDSAENSCRVLLKGEFIRARLVYTDESEAPVLSAMSRVRTEDTGTNQWKTYLNLEGLNLEDIDKVWVGCWPEAVDGDTHIINARNRCAYSQNDISGYGDEDGFACMNTDCDKYRAGTYGGATCWDTTASEFTLNPEEANSERALASKFWSAEPLVLQQGGSGAQIGSAASSHRNFAFERAGGQVPSLGSICGGFFWRPLVPISDRRTDSFFGPSMGSRRVYTDEQGRPAHEIQHGLFGGEYGFPPPISKVDGWSDRNNARGLAATGVDAVFPTHRGPSCSVINFAMGPDPSPFIRLARDGDGEVLFATAIDKNAVDALASSTVRGEVP